MTAGVFTELALDDLADRGLSPEFLRAIGIGEREPGVFEIPYSLRGEPPTLRTWAAGCEEDEWPATASPGLWWPTGRDGLNVIVCLGATDALFLSQQLFSVGHDGNLYRRPGLTRLLQNAVVAALPQDFEDLSLGWCRDPATNVPVMLQEIVVEFRERIFLAVSRPPEDAQPLTEKGDPCLNRFVDDFLAIGESYGIQPATVPLPWGKTWKTLLDNEDHPGARKRAALGGILDLWEAYSANAPERDRAEGSEASRR